MAKALDELLFDAERTLASVGVAHALIGGCARNVYAPPRATRDVDLAVAVSPEAYKRVALELQALGFVRRSEARSEPDVEVPDVALFSDESGWTVTAISGCPLPRCRARAAAPQALTATGTRRRT